MMALDDHTLREIADSVCLPLLGVGAALDGRADDGAPAERTLLGALVEIDGAWQGTVQLSCPTVLLDRMAGAMFGRPEGDIGTTERDETLLELTNLFGGTVKGLLPGPSRLGLPRSAAPDTADTVALAVGDESLFVSVYGFEADA